MSQPATSRGHARQLGRVIGICQRLADGDGDLASRAADALDVLQARADAITYTVEVDEFASIGAAEYRTLAVFCQSATRHVEPAEALILRELGVLAGERVQEVSQ